MSGHPPTMPVKTGRRVWKTLQEKEESYQRTRQSLLHYLEDRRKRLGMTQADVRDSPEEVQRRREQKALTDEYMQTRDSVDTM